MQVKIYIFILNIFKEKLEESGKPSMPQGSNFVKIERLALKSFIEEREEFICSNLLKQCPITPY